MTRWRKSSARFAPHVAGVSDSLYQYPSAKTLPGMPQIYSCKKPNSARDERLYRSRLTKLRALFLCSRHDTSPNRKKRRMSDSRPPSLIPSIENRGLICDPSPAHRGTSSSRSSHALIRSCRTASGSVPSPLTPTPIPVSDGRIARFRARRRIGKASSGGPSSRGPPSSRPRAATSGRSSTGSPSRNGWANLGPQRRGPASGEPPRGPSDEVPTCSPASLPGNFVNGASYLQLFRPIGRMSTGE